MLLRRTDLAMLAMASSGVMAQTSSQSNTTSKPSSASSSGTPTSSSSSSAATHTIGVGAVLHQFTPAQVNASVGDTIRYNFYPGGHKVIRAEFGQPCIPYEYTGINKTGFFSGDKSPQVLVNPPPNYDIVVNDTNPIFFYCGAPGSCIDYHMIGVINPTAEQSLDAQLEFAKNVTFQLLPGEPFPSETPKPRPTSGSPGGSGNGGGSNGNGNGGSGGRGDGLGAGAIAGIVIGGVAVIILLGALIYLFGRRGGFERAYRKSALLHPTGYHPAQQPGAPGGPHPQGGMVSPMTEQGPYGIGVSIPKSPGQETTSSFSAVPGHNHQEYSNGYNRWSPGVAPTGYGDHQVPRTSPGLTQHPNGHVPNQTPSIPVELPTAADQESPTLGRHGSPPLRQNR